MSFELFQRGGPLNAKRIGPDRYSLSISLPKDADGRVARECPTDKCVPGYFKLTPGTGLTRQSLAYCPYCRNAAEPTDFHTKEQARYAKEVVGREAANRMEQELRNALGMVFGRKRRLVDGLIKVDMELKRSPQFPVRRPYEDILRRDLVCPHCTLDHSVYGVAVWCPDCGADIFMTHVKAEIAVIEAILGDVERRRSELGVRVAARDLENALEDLVSVFEATLKFEVRRYRKAKGDTDDQIEAAMKPIGSRFQSVSHAVKLVPELCDSILLFPEGSADESKLDFIFQKRHPITHNFGVVDRKYLDRVRSGEAEGTEVRVEKEEILEAAQITDAALSNFHAALFPAPDSR